MQMYTFTFIYLVKIIPKGSEFLILKISFKIYLIKVKF